MSFGHIVKHLNDVDELFLFGNIQRKTISKGIRIRGTIYIPYKAYLWNND